MNYVINLSQRLKNALLGELQELIERFWPILASKWISVYKLVVNLDSFDGGNFLLSYSVDYSGNYLYLVTIGDDLGSMTEKLMTNLCCHLD